MPLDAWSARRRGNRGKLRLLGTTALVVAATTAGASPAAADSSQPASSGAGVPLIRVSPQQISPVVHLGDSATATVTVTNLRDDAVRLIGAEVFGDNLGTDWQFAGGCVGTVLAPGANCSYGMTFTPLVTGRFNGAFCVTGLSQAGAVADRECGGIHGVAL